MAHVPKMASGKISVARGIHCCPIFFFFYFFCPTSVSILWTHGCTHTSACVDIAYESPSLPNKTSSEIFVHKAGAVRSVGRIFINWVPDLAMSRRIGKNVLQSSSQTGSSSSPSYFDIFFPIGFLEEAFIRNMIIIPCINYIIIIYINNNVVINNNL